MRAKRAARQRNPRTYQPLQKVKRASQRAAQGRPIPKPGDCTPDPPAARDALTGWFTYVCTTGTLIVPAPRCVGPECRGKIGGPTPVLGFGGDIGAGSRGSFTQGARTLGVTAMDGIEISKGLAEIRKLRDDGTIDGYYAAAASRAFIERTGEGAERPAPFEAPSPLGAPIASGALKRMFPGGPGEPVGPSVTESCRCTPREPDAIDPLSEWLIYYVEGGVLLTPTKKCIAGGGRRKSFWQRTWENTLALVKPTPPPQPVPPLPQAPPPPPPGAAPAPKPPAPPGGYLCMDPRIWAPAFRPSPEPCVPPQIPYPG